jgi:uncharacterized protein YbcI
MNAGFSSAPHPLAQSFVPEELRQEGWLMSTAKPIPQPAGSMTAAISNAAVQIMAEYTGRGPTKARTTIHDDVILILMQDTLTKAERSLLKAGQGDFVLETRNRFQQTMRNDLVGAVERLSHRTVIAFMSTNHMEPDMAAEVFVCAPLDGN